MRREREPRPVVVKADSWALTSYRNLFICYSRLNLKFDPTKIIIDFPYILVWLVELYFATLTRGTVMCSTVREECKHLKEKQKQSQLQQLNI